MEPNNSLWDFVQQQAGKIGEQFLAHLSLTLVSLLLAILIAVPLGILIVRKRRWASTVLGLAGIMQTIPGIALIGFMIPLFGIGPLPAIIALFLYALLPIIRNTYTGIKGVDPAITEAASAMGMSPKDILWEVELPLAMPVILAGIRTAAVVTVGVATLAAYIAAGGLGEFIFGGIALNNTNMILAGAIPSALLAVLLDFSLSIIQKRRMTKIKPVSAILGILLISIPAALMLPLPLTTKLLAGFTPEFMGRRDGYLGLKDVYQLDLKSVIISDGVMYQAAAEKKLDIISGSSTDGRVRAYNLQVLKDDRNIFPPYFAAPIVNEKVLRNHPQLEPVLNMIAGLINDSIMTELNYRVDHLKQLPETVAKNFLEEKKLLKPRGRGNGGDITIGSKLYGDGYILAAMYDLLISGHTNLNVITKTGLGGTKICFEALVNQEIDLYPEYTGTGLLVILNSDPAVVDSLIASSEKVYDYVKTEFSRRYKIRWMDPIGFNNTYALMMRKEQAGALGINTISDINKHLR